VVPYVSSLAPDSSAPPFPPIYSKLGVLGLTFGFMDSVNINSNLYSMASLFDGPLTDLEDSEEETPPEPIRKGTQPHEGKSE
jgi:hypothetical protein